MNDRLKDFRNLKKVNEYMRFISEDNWRLISNNDEKPLRYLKAFNEIVNCNINVFSTIPLSCSNELLNNWLLRNMHVIETPFLYECTWLLPYVANSSFWCSISTPSLQKLILYQLDSIRQSGLCVIDTTREIIYDFECDESTLQCRKQIIV